MSRLMIRSKIALSCLAAGLLLVTGCGSSSSPTNPSTGSNSTTTPTTSANGSMSYKVDGTLITATEVKALYNAGIMSVSGGITSPYTDLAFALGASGPGTFSAGPISNVTATLYVGNPTTGWLVSPGIGSGSITIASLTSAGASGTFTFTMPPSTGTGTKTITDGVFNVKF